MIKQNWKKMKRTTNQANKELNVKEAINELCKVICLPDVRFLRTIDVVPSRNVRRVLFGKHNLCSNKEIEPYCDHYVYKEGDTIEEDIYSVFTLMIKDMIIYPVLAGVDFDVSMSIVCDTIEKAYTCKRIDAMIHDFYLKSGLTHYYQRFVQGRYVIQKDKVCVPCTLVDFNYKCLRDFHVFTILDFEQFDKEKLFGHMMAMLHPSNESRMHWNTTVVAFTNPTKSLLVHMALCRPVFGKWNIESFGPFRAKYGLGWIRG